MKYEVYNATVLISNLIIIILSIIGMYKSDKYNYSLNKIFYLFSFFFFGISPAIEFLLKVNYWKGQDIQIYKYSLMNLLIIVIIIIYMSFYNIFSKLKLFKFEKKIINYFSKQLKSKKKIKFFMIIISIFSFLILLYTNNFNIYSFLLRGGEGVERIKTEKMVGLIIDTFIKPLPIAVFLIFKIKQIKDKKLELLLLLFALITNFPTSVARFYMAAVYIPIIILYIPIMRRRLILNQILIVGLLFIFPFLDNLRRFSSMSDLKFGFNFKMFLEGHFDSYQNFLRVVDNNVVTNGKQLITAALFFVPRKIWSSKSIGSGSYLAEKIGLSFDNISMNYFAEGYINFGYIGILIFTLILAFINSRFDKIYWKNLTNGNILKVIYLLFLGMEFFILRGDLLSSFAYTFGILFAVYFVYQILKK